MVVARGFRIDAGPESGKEEVKTKAGAAYGRPCLEATNVNRARSTVVAVPPGKRNGREHQDLRRRHLLVREIVNDPRTSNIAELRPSRKLSAYHGVFHHSIPSVFHQCVRAERLARFSEHPPRSHALIPGPWLTAVLIDAAG